MLSGRRLARLLPLAAWFSLAAAHGAHATTFEEVARACGSTRSGQFPGLPESVAQSVRDTGATVDTAAFTQYAGSGAFPVTVSASGGGSIVELGVCSVGGDSEARVILGFSLDVLAPPPLPEPVPIRILASGTAQVTQTSGFAVSRLRAAVGAQSQAAEACLGDPFFCPNGQIGMAAFASPFVVSLLPGDYELVFESQGGFAGVGTYDGALSLLGIEIDPTFPDVESYRLTIDPIPEPSAFWLASLALAALAGVRRGRMR